MNVKELTEQLLQGSEELTLGPDLKVREAFTGDISHLRRASVEFLYDFSVPGGFSVCESHVVITGLFTNYMQHGYEAFAAFFYGVEQNTGISIDLYDEPCFEQIYILQKIPNTSDAVFTIKECTDGCCTEDLCTTIYQVVVSLKEIIESYKRTVRFVFSDRAIAYWKGAVTDDLKDSLATAEQELPDMVAQWIEWLRYYSMFRKDSWFYKKTLPELKMEDFFSLEEIEKMKNILDVVDLTNYPEYYAEKNKAEEESQ